jgi:hypothetical protein
MHSFFRLLHILLRYLSQRSAFAASLIQIGEMANLSQHIKISMDQASAPCALDVYVMYILLTVEHIDS